MRGMQFNFDSYQNLLGISLLYPLRKWQKKNAVYDMENFEFSAK